MCEVIGCEVPTEKYFCEHHWALIPKELRQELAEHWSDVKTRGWYRALIAARRIATHMEVP